MKTLTIRGLPDEVHARLKKQAQENRRSLNQEVIAELVSGERNNERGAFVRSMLEEADAVYGAVSKPMTTDEIRKAIDDGRD